MLGMQKEPIIANFVNQMPAKFSVSHEKPFIMSGVMVDIDTLTGKAVHIERVQVVDHELVVDENNDE
jgi:calcineurin-like phosphoesterase